MVISLDVNIVRGTSPLTAYTHCSGHRLNLVIAHACPLPVVRNAIDKLKAISLFLVGNPKRSGLLECIVNKEVTDSTTRKPLIEMCRTR